MEEKMKRTVSIWILIFISTFLFQEKLYAYSTDVHKEITKRVIDQNFSKLNKYINDYIGLTSGLAEFINKKPIRKWIEHGSEWEDYDIGSVLDLLASHYYNPYTNKGLTEGGITIGESAYDRANNPINYWGWKSARENFYIGLTSTVKNWRETKLADSFDALGHVMHLIQDIGVPAHTRDDMHVPYVDGEPYELYTKNNWISLNYNSVSFPYWNVSISPSAPKQFWDLDSYTGAVAYDSGYIGLSEYTHANFLSKDTIFKYFPHPDPAPPNTNYYDFGLLPYTVITTPGNINHNTFYITGYGKQHLAALKYLAGELWNLPIPLPRVYQLTLHLDNRCHEEYAQYLVPRAVGYSAGLLDYFFRGQLQVTAVPIFYKNSIVYLRVRIKNMTPNETMKDGEFTITYSYRPTGGKADGSDDIWGQAPVVSSGTLEYGGDDQHPVEDTVIDFWLPNPIPKENYDSAKFTLAFKGTLGNEVGAVIGKALTLGEIKFEEEWNNGLNGNHNWAHTDITLLGQNPDNGSTSNILVGDTLIKDNIRHVGKRTARVNESYVGYDTLNNQFIDILPIRITPDTYIQFKIDEMWINQRTPAPPGYTNDWQHLVLRFNNGLGIQYTTQGQGVYLGSTCGNFEFDPNLIIVDNIYELFEAAGITIPPGDLYLRNIAFIQQLSILEENSDMEHHQHMKIDSIRIVEGKQ
jgi:hypothetical protein